MVCLNKAKPNAVQYPVLTLVEFNPRRVMRGAEGARFKVQYSSDPGDSELLWMSIKDIKANIDSNDDNPAALAELNKGLEAYAKGVRIP